MPEYQAGEIVLGRYQILKKIGQGGFGEVYLAKHLQLKSFCALKVLRRDLPGMQENYFNEIRDRFMIEARLGEKLNHPNVVKEHENYILALEYASSGSLLDLLARTGNLPVDQVLRIAVEMASGLAAIHALDVVHRDLKPSNILFDQNQQAKIADLGLAQLSGGASMRSFLGSESAGSAQPGTRAYMSPEQETSSAYLKPASDVFSLGVILFEMLTGRNVKNLAPGTPVSAFRPDVPAWLDILLRKMLATNPVERPWDGQQVFDALQGGIPGSAHPADPIILSQPAGSRRIPEKPRMNWIYFALFFMLVAGVSFGGLIYFTGLFRFAIPGQSTAGALLTPQPAGTNDRVVEYLVSSANSMLQPMNGNSKQIMVAQALGQHWSGWNTANSGVGAALRVFGSQYNAANSAKSCLDTSLLAAPSNSPASFTNMLNSSEPRGLAPIAEALSAAAGDFQAGQSKALVLITDSGDTCAGDPCNWAITQYRDAGLVMPVFVMDLGGKSGLACLATESGGRYFPVNSQAELQSALQESLKGSLP